MGNRKIKKIILLFLCLFFITACSQQKKTQDNSHSEKIESQVNHGKEEEKVEESAVSEAILLKILKKDIPINDYLNKKVTFKSTAMSKSENRISLDGKRYIQVYIDKMTYFLLVKTEGIDENFQYSDNITVVGTIKGFESAENSFGKTEILIVEPEYLEDSNGNQYKHN